MNVAIDKVLYHLTGNGDINTVTVAELERVTTEHPYFSVGQLLLAHKHNITNSPDFLPQVQKTALYIPNALWLQYQLQTEEPELRLPTAVEEEDIKPLLNKVVEEENNIHIPSIERVREIMDGVESKPAPVVDETLEPEEKIDEPVEVPQPVVAEIAGDVKNEVAVEEPVKEEEKTEEEFSLVTNESIEEPVKNAVEEEHAVEETYINNVPQSTITNDNSASEELSVAAEILDKEEQQEETADEVPVEELPRLTPQPTIPEEDCAEETYPETTEEVIEHIEMDEKQRSTIASMLDEQVAEFKKPVTADTPLPIETEPYHTVDYFASQGIKVNLDLKSQDKLSKQLRKFTDWLKHMKSIPPDTADLGTDPELEGAIHNIANTSNEAKEIVTETMAEVLVKQGKIEKAIQLYIKLSFLNPDKSAYFAAKIQELKGI